MTFLQGNETNIATIRLLWKQEYLCSLADKDGTTRGEVRGIDIFALARLWGGYYATVYILKS